VIGCSEEDVIIKIQDSFLSRYSHTSKYRCIIGIE